MQNKQDINTMDYGDYWHEVWEAREKSRYYQKRYNRVKNRIVVANSDKILDVGGGNGHFLHFIGVKKADIIDISNSGLKVAKEHGYGVIKSDIEQKFPIADETYDVAFCFEILEHLHFPEKPMSEMRRVLKKGGILYIGQPNMKADGTHHIKRFYLQDLLTLTKNHGFDITWIDFVPAFSARDAIISDIKITKSILRKIKQSVALILSFLPYGVRYMMAKLIPNRFALFFIVKAIKR